MPSRDLTLFPRLAALKRATEMMKKECQATSFVHITFSDDMVVYPVMIVGKTKKGGNLLCAFANRVDT